jgi:hypothetical protein
LKNDQYRKINGNDCEKFVDHKYNQSNTVSLISYHKPPYVFMKTDIQSTLLVMPILVMPILVMRKIFGPDFFGLKIRQIGSLSYASLTYTYAIFEKFLVFFSSISYAIFVFLRFVFQIFDFIDFSFSV